MNCLYCNESTRVVDSRNVDDGSSVRRRRECEDCGQRFTTYERSQLRNVEVQKRDGHTEPFRREKLAAGIRKAFEKRPVEEDRLVSLISAIEEDVRSRREPVVESETIGELACQRIKEVDEVAYLRFASVYKDFSDGAQFVQELRDLPSDNGSAQELAHDSNSEVTKHG